MRAKKEIFLVIFTGFLVVSLLLEIGLRIIGYMHLESVEKGFGKKEPGKYRILCLGDSLTYGVDVARGRTYPKQLENLLKNKFKDKDISVINKGMAGYNSAQVLNELESNLEEVNPDMVTVLIGAQNDVNLWGYKRPGEERMFVSRMRNILYRVRLYKLVKYLYSEIKNKIESERMIREYSEKEQQNNIKAKHLPDHPRERKQAEAILKKAIKINPNNHTLRTELNEIRSGVQRSIDRKRIGDILYHEIGDAKRAIEYYIKALERDPNDGWIYHRISTIYVDLGENLKAIQLQRRFQFLMM